MIDMNEEILLGEQKDLQSSALFLNNARIHASKGYLYFKCCYYFIWRIIVTYRLKNFSTSFCSATFQIVDLLVRVPYYEYIKVDFENF